MNLLRIPADFRKFFHGTVPPLALVAITVLPLLFGGLFVWAYFDPIGHLNRMPVALVNSDAGIVLEDGSILDAGHDVADELMDSEALNFHLVDAEQARTGIEKGDYYLGIEIPSDFSASVASVDSDDPHSATIAVTLRNTNGFIPTMLGNQATTIMADTVGRNIGEEIADELLVGFNTIGDGVDHAAEGAQQLADGTHDVREGTGDLAEGVATLDKGIADADRGAHDLVDGADRIDDGARELADGTRRLDEGIGSAADGAETLSSGMTQLQSGTGQLGAGAEEVAGGVDQLVTASEGAADVLDGAQTQLSVIVSGLTDASAALQNVPGTKDVREQIDDLVAQLTAGDSAGVADGNLHEQLHLLQSGAHELSRQLNDPSAEYRSGIDDAAEAAERLSEGLAALSAGSGTLVSGASELSDGTSTLVVGARTLADGTTRLAEGSEQLLIGVGAIRNGLVTLDDGAGELALRMGEAGKDIPRWEDGRRTAAAAALGSPVHRELTGEGPVEFGKGLAPFFLSLSMWMGAVVAFMVLRPLNRRAIDSGVAPLRAAIANYFPAMLVGLVQAILVWGVEVWAIDVDPAHPGWMLIALCAVSATFVAVVQAINALLGSAAGRVIALMLMSLQLVSSNGVYPPEVQPKFIQWVHSWDPMRFTVDLFRAAMTGPVGSSDSRVGHALTVMALLFAVSLAATSWAAHRQRVIAPKDLHPELVL